LRFFNSNHDVKLVPHFPVLHFPTLEIRSFIFQSCRSVFDLFGDYWSFIFRSCIFSPLYVAR